MDIWLLMCLLFVALATFEYAILLKMTFWKTRKVMTMGDSVDEEKRDKICHSIDCLALPIFSFIYTLSVISYFTVLLG